jgi:hypothetical protein
MSETLAACDVSCTDRLNYKDYYHRNCTAESKTSASNFYKLFIDLHEPAKILLVNNNFCDNIQYTIGKGWKVDVLLADGVDAKQAIVNEAARHGVNVIGEGIPSFRAGKTYNAVALNYLQVAPAIRTGFHAEVAKALAHGGYLLVEEFLSPQAMTDAAMQDSLDEIVHEFPGVEMLYSEQKEINFMSREGNITKARVLRLLGRKQ